MEVQPPSQCQPHGVQQDQGPGPAPELRQSQHKYRLVRESKRSSGEKDLGAFVNKKFSMTRQYVLAAQKVNHVQGCIKRRVASTSTEMIPTLYAAFLRPHLEFCIQVWGPQSRRDMGLLKRVQRRDTRMV